MFSFFKKKPSESNTSLYKGKMKQPGFIVGTGRCGTTILASVLNAHSRICVPHELQIIVIRGLYEKYCSGEAQRFTAEDFIRFIAERCPYHFEKYFDYISHFRSLSYPQKNLRTLLTELFDHICYDARKDVFLEQYPANGQKLDVLQDLFADMKVIHMIRDGRDVAISYARTPWWTKDIMANLDRWEKRINVVHAFCREHPENCLELKYEDLVEQPQTALTKILRLFELEYEENMLDPAHLIDYLPLFKDDALAVQSSQFLQWGQEKRSVFFSGNIYGWKKQEASFDVLSERVKKTLNHFGYET